MSNPKVREMPPEVHSMINAYMGESGKEYDYYQFIYYSWHWNTHHTILKTLVEKYGEAQVDAWKEQYGRGMAW